MAKHEATTRYTTGTEVTTIRLGAMRAAMDELFERDGITISEQIRRALVEFLNKKGVTVTKGRSRG